jgi:hypothetical protein
MRAHAHAVLPAAGQRAMLRRHVLKAVGELSRSEWPEIAEVQIDKVSKGRLHLTVVRDRSAATLAEGEQDPFAYDAPVRLVWRRR